MNKAIFPVAFLGLTTLAACSFQLKAGGSGAQSPQQGQSGTAAQPTTAPAPAPTPQPRLTGPAKSLGKARFPAATPSGSPSATPTGAPTTDPSTPTNPTGIAVVSGVTAFGGPTPDAAGFKGSLFFIPAGTKKMPDLGTMQPNGVLFTKELNIGSRAFTEGFPGVDAARKENFAIRYEAPLVVENEADYEFRLASDDGSLLLIDGTKIVDNDGDRDAVASKSGPVHLVKGTHVITIDYFQGTGNVALQVFCKKAGGTEAVCPTKL